MSSEAIEIMQAPTETLQKTPILADAYYMRKGLNQTTQVWDRWSLSTFNCELSTVF
jgi:hypothetical protein